MCCSTGAMFILRPSSTFNSRRHTRAAEAGQYRIRLIRYRRPSSRDMRQCVIRTDLLNSREPSECCKISSETNGNKDTAMDKAFDKIWDGSAFSGTAIVYAATTENHVADQFDFKIDMLVETDPTEVRARYLQQPRPRDFPSDKLDKQLLVVVGPQMSANDVVTSLRYLASNIEKTGLLIGRYKDENYLVETAGNEPTLIGHRANATTAA